MKLGAGDLGGHEGIHHPILLSHAEDSLQTSKGGAEEGKRT